MTPPDTKKMGPPAIELRQMTRQDVPGVTDLHLKAFPGFFLSFLGRHFLELYYDHISVCADAIRLVCADETGQIIGFCVGSVVPAGFYRRLLRKKWWAFAWASIPAVLRRPQVLPRLIRALAYPQKQSAEPHSAGLYSLCVASDARRHRLGARLVSSFVLEAERRGSRCVYLTTDAVGNDAVNRFYESLNFRLARRYVTAEGREMNHLMREI
jgi:ribosomal protein S18 acetylase RimI-like enzyme